jgi:hypothetical protein
MASCALVLFVFLVATLSRTTGAADDVVPAASVTPTLQLADREQLMVQLREWMENHGSIHNGIALNLFSDTGMCSAMLHV